MSDDVVQSRDRVLKHIEKIKQLDEREWERIDRTLEDVGKLEDRLKRAARLDDYVILDKPFTV